MNLGKVEIWETSLDRIVTLREGAKGVCAHPEPVTLPSLVRFNFIDCVYDIFPRSLSCPEKFGFSFRGFKDGEIDLPLLGTLEIRAGLEQLVGQVIEGAAKLLDCLTSSKRDACRGIADTDNFVDQLFRLRIVLGPDFIGVGIEEGSGCNFLTLPDCRY